MKRNMLKSKSKKVAAKKLVKRTNASFYTRIGKNLEKSETGLYRVRKTVDGVDYSYTCTTLKAAKNTLKSL